MTKKQPKDKGVLHREIARAGLWVAAGHELAAPVRAAGLSSITVASGYLKITPDIDVLAWLCAEWLEHPTDDGLMRPSFYRMTEDLYGNDSGKAYQLIDESLERLGRTTIEFEFYSEPYTHEAFKSGGSIISYIKRRKTNDGVYHNPVIDLHLGLRTGIETTERVNLDWRLLRQFHGRQQLAKRLWCYLQAERWQRAGQTGIESTWVALGGRLYTTLGMDYKEPRAAKRSLKLACETIKNVDLRYRAPEAQLSIEPRGENDLLVAKRPTSSRWKKEEAQVRDRLSQIWALKDTSQ